ncbi:hypothetical protein GEMRC1_007729 [Eukaryota sp. GEM-RC1]
MDLGANPFHWLERVTSLDKVDPELDILRTFPLEQKRSIIASVLSCLSQADDVNSLLQDLSQTNWTISVLGSAFCLPFTDSSDRQLSIDALSVFRSWILTSSSPSLLKWDNGTLKNIILFTLLSFHPRTGGEGPAEASLHDQKLLITDVLYFYKEMTVHFPSSKNADVILRVLLCASDLSMRLPYTNSSTYAGSMCPLVLPTLFDVLFMMKIDEGSYELWDTFSRLMIAFTGGALHPPGTSGKELVSKRLSSGQKQSEVIGWRKPVDVGARRLAGQVWSLAINNLTDFLTSEPSTLSYNWIGGLGVKKIQFDCDPDTIKYQFFRVLYSIGDLSTIEDAELSQVVFETISGVVSKFVEFNKNSLYSKRTKFYTPNTLIKLFGSWCFSLLLSPITVSQPAKSAAIKSLCLIYTPISPSVKLIPTTHLHIFIHTLIQVLSSLTEDLPVRTLLSFLPTLLSSEYLHKIIIPIVPLIVFQCSRHLGLSFPTPRSPANLMTRNHCISLLATIIGIVNVKPLSNEFNCPFESLSLDLFLHEGSSKAPVTAVTTTASERTVNNPLWKSKEVKEPVVESAPEPVSDDFTLEIVQKIQNLVQFPSDAAALLVGIRTFYDALIAINSILLSCLKVEKNLDVLLGTIKVLAQILRVSAHIVTCGHQKLVEPSLSIICSLISLLNNRPEAWDIEVFSGILDFFQGIRPSLISCMKSKNSKQVFGFVLFSLAKLCQSPPPFQGQTNCNLPLLAHILRTVDIMIAWPELHSTMDFVLHTEPLIPLLLKVCCSYSQVEDEEPPVKKPKSFRFGQTDSPLPQDKSRDTYASLIRNTSLSLLSTVLRISFSFVGHPPLGKLLKSFKDLSLRLSSSSDISEVDLLNYLSIWQEQINQTGKEENSVDLRSLLRFFLVNDDVLVSSMDLPENRALLLLRSFSSRLCWLFKFLCDESPVTDKSLSFKLVGESTLNISTHDLIAGTILCYFNDSKGYDLPSVNELFTRAQAYPQTTSFASLWAASLSKMAKLPRKKGPISHEFSPCAIPKVWDQSFSNISTSRQFLWLMDLLQAEPFFFTLNSDTKFARSLKHLDSIPDRECSKLGVVYVGPGQNTQNEILSNDAGSQLFDDFLNCLGCFIDITSHTGFLGGLDRYGITGSRAVYYADAQNEVIYHVQTLMPTNPKDPQQIHKKKHIGNDFVHIVFNESGSDYQPNTITSQFNFVHIIITPLFNKMVRILIHTKDNSVPNFGPLYSGSVLPFDVAADLVRETALNANRVTRLSNTGFKFPFITRKAAVDDILLKHIGTGPHENALSSVLSESSNYFSMG